MVVRWSPKPPAWVRFLPRLLKQKTPQLRGLLFYSKRDKELNKGAAKSKLLFSLSCPARPGRAQRGWSSRINVTYSL